jgi:hypothetical protein
LTGGKRGEREMAVQTRNKQNELDNLASTILMQGVSNHEVLVFAIYFSVVHNSLSFTKMSCS